MTKKAIILRRILSAALAACMLSGVLAVMPLSVSAAATIDSCAPAGTVNVAPGSTVTLSKCSEQRAGAENSYEMPSENWSKAMLVDGKLNNGWSTDPYDKEQDRSEPVTVTLKLPSSSEISAIALFPNGCFPAKYTVSVSSDGKTYTKVADGSCDVGKPTEPDVHHFAATQAQYVQIHVTERSLTVTGDGALVQFGEIAVYGKASVSMSLIRTSLELTVGETDVLTPVFKGISETPAVTYQSSHPSVVAVNGSGQLTAKATGEATITVTCASAGLTATCRVAVVEDIHDFDENIMLSIFWPPTPDYITDEQYKLIADAGVNWVMGSGEETLATPENQKKMLELCAKYGIGMTVSDGNFGNNLLGKSQEKIAEYVGNYKNVPGAYGFYILDEPFNPNGYVDAYIALKKANPEAYMHLNFLPGGAYGSQERYYSQMNDWCVLCANSGYPVDYLIFDNYPFGLQAGSMDRAGFMANLRTCHDVGLANGVKTGTYIQTVQQDVAFRRPTDSEIRYEMYLALAFGYKQLSFFTWFTPVNRSEPFSDGIIAADGTPNAHYETVKTINHEILAIGETLVKCDALEIYLNGETWGQPSIPEDFFVQPADSKNYTVSFLRHKETGRNYLMVVNNHFSQKQTIRLTFDQAITSLFEVSRTDGSLKPLTMDGQSLSLTLAAGDAMLMALPEGYDHLKAPEEPSAGTNLATLEGASVSATTSMGANGYYINLLTDGKRFSDGISTGWSTNERSAGQIDLDLGAVRQVNRVDLYPCGSLFDYGDTFPSDFEILVSKDGEVYTSVAKEKGYDVSDRGYTAAFDTVEARYIRVAIAAERRGMTLCEIEVYNDDGTVPDMPAFSDMQDGDEVIEYTEGQNIAKGKVTYASSTTPDGTYKQWGWSLEYINDGIAGAGNGWTSNVKLNATPSATEYVIIDFGDLFAVERVKVTPLGYFPEDYRIQLSVDGKTWTDISNVKGSESMTAAFEIKPEKTVNARYLRFMGTKLRGGGADGYLLQLSEIEAYGKPVCDKTVLSNAMEAYLAAGGAENAKEYTDAKAAVDNALLTQTQANALAEALLALVAPEIPEETTTSDEATEPVETQTAPVGTDSSETAASHETDAKAADEKGGCSSSILPSVFLAALVPAAVAMCAKRKED